MVWWLIVGDHFCFLGVEQKAIFCIFIVYPGNELLCLCDVVRQEANVIYEVEISECDCWCSGLLPRQQAITLISFKFRLRTRKNVESDVKTKHIHTHTQAYIHTHSACTHTRTPVRTQNMEVLV